jgi:hypothetical protein
MAKNEFHDRLRQFLHRQPFLPLLIEFEDGRRIVIKQPPVVFSDGAASFIDPADGALVDFSHDEVKTLALLEQGTRA